jgi:hypothetical protein
VGCLKRWRGAEVFGSDCHIYAGLFPIRLAKLQGTPSRHLFRSETSVTTLGTSPQTPVRLEPDFFALLEKNALRPGRRDDRHPVGLFSHRDIIVLSLANTIFPPQGRGLRPRTAINMASPASSDEGEIRDGGVEKATTSLPMYDGSSVDRPDRNRSSHSKSMSPEHGGRFRDRRSRDRSRSPFSDRQARGSKRAREEEYTDRSRDPRRFKVHYEDAPQYHKHRSRVPYEDLDRGPASSADLRYDDRDRYAGKRSRTRSRSPYRSDRHGRGEQSRKDDRYGRGNEDRRPSPYGNGDYGRERKDLSVSKRGPSPLPADHSRREAKTTQGYSQHHNDKSSKNMELEK